MTHNPEQKKALNELRWAAKSVMDGRQALKDSWRIAKHVMTPSACMIPDNADRAADHVARDIKMLSGQLRERIAFMHKKLAQAESAGLFFDITQRSADYHSKRRHLG